MELESVSVSRVSIGDWNLFYQRRCCEGDEHFMTNVRVERNWAKLINDLKEKDLHGGISQKTMGESPATATKTSAQWQRCVIIDHYFGFDISLGCATKISDKGCLTNMSEHGFDVFATAPKLAAKLLCASFVLVSEQEKREFWVNDKAQETTTAKTSIVKFWEDEDFRMQLSMPIFQQKDFVEFKTSPSWSNVSKMKSIVLLFYQSKWKQSKANVNVFEEVFKGEIVQALSGINFTNAMHVVERLHYSRLVAAIYLFKGSKRKRTLPAKICWQKTIKFCYKLFLCDQFFWIFEQQFQTTNGYFNRINHASWNHFCFLESVLLIVDFRFWGCSWEIDVL